MMRKNDKEDKLCQEVQYSFVPVQIHKFSGNKLVKPMLNRDNVHRRSVRVASCQVPDLGQDLDSVLKCIKTFSEKANSQNVKLLCFPECFLQGYLVEKELAHRYALGLTSDAFKKVLEQLPGGGPMLVIGMTEMEHGRLYNSAIVVRERKLVGSYRKTHLLKGEAIFDAGISYPVFEVDGLRFGINICYDTNFSNAALSLAKQGADLIVCPANNMMGRIKSEALKDVHNSVRAQRCIETGLWLISADITGDSGNRVSFGPTAVIDPRGEIISQVPLLQVGMVTADIPLK